jgi:cellulose 1,4-beta-cellobiosidase
VITLAVLLLGGFSAYRAFSPRAAASRPAVAAPSSPAASLPETSPQARLCGQAGWPEAPVGGGAYIVQNDEWNSTVPECITTDGNPQFTVTSSSINEPANGDPGGYPSIFSGCSAGVCTAGTKLPIRVSSLSPGLITSSWATSQPPGGAYDAAYDIWFDHTSATSGAPDGGELMIWLAHRGGSQIAPAGVPVGQTTIGGYAYTIWLFRDTPGRGPAYYRIAYVMNRAARSVQNLDIGAVAADAARRGYLAGTSYLLNVQAGFEIWQGGEGLTTKSFAVTTGK